MIDERADPCDGCGKPSFILICDNAHQNAVTELPLYFCTSCCEIIGHEPPFTDQELSFMRLDLEGIH